MMIEYQLGKKDFSEIAHAVPIGKARVLQICVSIIGILAVWALVFLSGFDWRFCAGLTLFFVLLPVVSTGFHRRRLSKRLEKTPFYAGIIRAEIGDEGIKMTYPTGESFTRWNGHSRRKETENLFLLFIGEAFFRAYPKRAFTPTQLSNFRAMLDQHLSNG